MAFLVWTLHLVVAGVCYVVLGQGQDAFNVGSHNIETAKVEEQRGKGSCLWESPPQNGYNFRPCSEGLCRDSPGVHKRNGTLRFTRCDRHYVLVGGRDKDICINSQWTSSGHRCIPCGRSQSTFNPYEDLTLIHYGHNSSRGDFPWMAALYTPLDGGRWEQICGGTLISPRLVLSGGSRSVEAPSSLLDLFYQVQHSFNPYEDLTLIHYGHNSSRGDFPWMAALYTPLDGGRWEQICGGTLISPRLVLSAAHCFHISGKDLKPEDLRVGLGKLFSSFYQDESAAITSSVQEIVRPERYLGVDHLFDLDIALLVLQQNVVTGPYIMPACIDWGVAMEPKHNDIGYLAGWGVTEEGKPSAVLKWASQKYVQYEQCRGMIAPRDKKLVTQDKFCVGEVKGGKADKGDSGGGLTFLHDGTHYIYGVVSTKLSADDKNVRLFTNVLNDGHLAWLRRHWRRLLLNNQECLQSSDCSGSRDCVHGSCVDSSPVTPSCAPTEVEMGRHRSRGTWDNFYGSQFPFSINGRQFFYRHEEKGRRWFIQELLPGGLIGEETDSGVWDKYFKSSFPFFINGRYFFLAQAENEHNKNSWFIRELLPGGKMGKETDNGSWNNFYKNMFTFSINGRHFFYGQNEKPGDLYWFVSELTSEGKVGSEMGSGYWKFYYPTHVPFSIGGKQFYFGQSDNKYWFISELLPDGKIGEEKDHGNWQHFYYSIPFSIGCRQFIYGQNNNSSNHNWYISELLPEGKLGPELDFGYWEHFNDVQFTFSLKGRYFLYAHTKVTNDWFIREISYSL